MSWGLVIQGPKISFGQGPNSNLTGYNSTRDVLTNVEALGDYFSAIVLSTWKNENFDLPCGIQSFQILSTSPPKSHRDIDNRKKQIISLSEGIRVLSEQNITHVLKIRTDQVIPVGLVKFIQDYFIENSNEPKLMVSEFLGYENFYCGDFMFAGHIRLVEKFCAANLKSKIKFHPVATKDYILKFCNSVGLFPSFVKFFPPLFLYLFCISTQPKVIVLWAKIRANLFFAPPRELFLDISWRGIRMRQMQIWDSFSFYGEDSVISSAELKAKTHGRNRAELAKYFQLRVKFLKGLIKKYLLKAKF